MKRFLGPALRVVGGVIALSVVVAAGAMLWLGTLGPDDAGFASRLAEAEAELSTREAALEACSGACDEERRAVDKQRALVEVIRQEM